MERIAQLFQGLVDRSKLHCYVLRVYMFYASQPALTQVNDFGYKSFKFHAGAWFPLAVMLNLFFHTEPDLQEMGIVKSMSMLSFSLLCTVFCTFKLSAMSMINKYSMVLANSHVIVALFSIGLTDGQDDHDASCFKYQATCILLVSPFLKSGGAANAMLFRLCGISIILLISVLPWMLIGWEVRIRVLNLLSTCFLVFLVLVFELNESPVYSLLSCLKFILVCTSVIVFEGIAQMMRDSNDNCEFQESETHPQEQ